MMDRKEQVKRIKSLYAEVVASAIRDYKKPNLAWCRDAKEFLESKWLEFYLEPLNIHADFIRRELCLTSTSTDEKY